MRKHMNIHFIVSDNTLFAEERRRFSVADQDRLSDQVRQGLFCYKETHYDHTGTACCDGLFEIHSFWVHKSTFHSLSIYIPQEPLSSTFILFAHSFTR